MKSYDKDGKVEELNCCLCGKTTESIGEYVSTKIGIYLPFKGLNSSVAHESCILKALSIRKTVHDAIREDAQRETDRWDKLKDDFK